MYTAIDCVFLIPKETAFDVHVLETERVLGPDQSRQGADFNVEISFDKFQIALRKGPIDVFDRICGRKKWHSDSGQVIGAALQIELPPTGGLLDKNLGIADIPVRRRVA